MAWYYGTFSCGHEGRVNIIGPTKDRQRKADVRFNNGLCEECWEKQKLEERERLKKEALERAVEMELPALTGTEKQVEWAMRLRQSLINKFEKIDKENLSYREIRHYSDEDIDRVLYYILENQTEARYYIDNRFETSVDIIKKESKNALKSDEQKFQEEIDREMQLQTLKESTVYPREQITSLIAEIKLDDTKVSATFPELNEEFRLTLRELGYRWSGDEWVRELSKCNGDVSDRAAELGHTLLGKGFPVCILDNEVREKAVEGNFKEEHTRWIVAFTGKRTHLGIQWKRDVEDFYHMSRRLPGSSWENPYVVVPVTSFEEILDFADMYQFKITKAAQKLIESARKAKGEALIADVKVKQRNKFIADTVPDKLEAPTEVKIDDELRESD